jgi:hypothetical protein
VRKDKRVAWQGAFSKGGRTTDTPGRGGRRYLLVRVAASLSGEQLDSGQGDKRISRAREQPGVPLSSI